MSARHVVVSVPPALALDIAFDPPLPDDRTALYRNAIGGPETKTLVVYDEPFWRADGFSGQTAEPGSVAEVTLDASRVRDARRHRRRSRSDRSPSASTRSTPPSVARRCSTRWPRGSARARRARRVHRDLVVDARSGPAAARWRTSRPGILTRYGHLLREPFGRVHWAGTETATISHGAIDGAVRSGERAAAEILDRA